jgi:hypothetical protein
MPVLRIGDRIRVKVNGMKWGGVEVPRGTEGTVYLHTRPNGMAWRCVAWDGFPVLQANGYPYGIGGDASKDYLPDWAELVTRRPAEPSPGFYATEANANSGQ